MQEKQVQAVYRLLAPSYDRLRPLWAGHKLGDAEDFLEREILPRYCPSGSVFLDLGCGTAVNLERMLRLGIPFQRYVGVDISPAMLHRARRKFTWPKSAEFYLGDALQLPFGENVFDFVLSTWVLEHVAQVKLAVDESLRVLKGGAYLVLVFHSLPHLPQRIPVRLIGFVFRLALQIRFLAERDYSSLNGRIATWQFAWGFHTLLLLKKGASS